MPVQSAAWATRPPPSAKCPASGTTWQSRRTPTSAPSRPALNGTSAPRSATCVIRTAPSFTPWATHSLKPSYLLSVARVHAIRSLLTVMTRQPSGRTRGPAYSRSWASIMASPSIRMTRPRSSSSTPSRDPSGWSVQISGNLMLESRFNHNKVNM